MEVTGELKDYSYITMFDDCFKETKFITEYKRFFFHCKVCLSVSTLFHTFEEGKILLEYKSKEESLKFHFFYMFSDYVMFLFRNKRCYSTNFLVLLQLHLLISCDKNLTTMFVASISKYSVTFIS